MERVFSPFPETQTVATPWAWACGCLSVRAWFVLTSYSVHRPGCPLQHEAITVLADTEHLVRRTVGTTLQAFLCVMSQLMRLNVLPAMRDGLGT